jgi:hypothetical protein
VQREFKEEKVDFECVRYQELNPGPCACKQALYYLGHILSPFFVFILFLRHGLLTFSRAGFELVITLPLSPAYNPRIIGNTPPLPVMSREKVDVTNDPGRIRYPYVRKWTSTQIS